MLKNHILLAFRHLKKEKGYMIASIVGLAMAFTACFFTFSFIWHEYSADRHFADPEHTYRLKNNDAIDSPIRFPVLPISNAQYMEDHFPEVNFSVPVYQEGGEQEITVKGKMFTEKLWAYTEAEAVLLFDSSYFDIKNTFEAGTVLLNHSTAIKLFGRANPVGETIDLKEGKYTVVGTFKDFPTNSHLTVNVLAIPLPSKKMDYSQGLVYVNVRPDADIVALNQKVDEESVNMDKFIDVIRYTLVSVEDMYLVEMDNGPLLRSANQEMINMMGMISTIILFISIFNIINLTQVKTLFRGREMGVKKVLGITPAQMLLQFLVESAVVVLLAAMLSVSFIQFASGEVLSYLHIDGAAFTMSAVFLIILMVSVITLLAGIQGALFSKVMPRDVIAGKFKMGERKWLLKSMVGLQFLIACTLIGGTLLVDKQTDYIMAKPLGFAIDDLWYIPSPSAETDLRLLRDRLLTIPEVQSATISSGLPFVGTGGILQPAGEQKELEFVAYISIDKNFLNTLNVSFEREPIFLPDTGFIVNEALINRQDLYPEPESREAFLGVVSDFHFNSLASPIGPLLMSLEDPSSGYLTMRIDERAKTTAQTKVKAEWDRLYDGRPFEFLALSDIYLQKHHEASELAVVLKALSFVAVFISCIGLASLTGFFVRKRFKEIAIRKVLGATIEQVIRQVNVGYAAWIGGATGVSMLVVYYYGTEWLAGYAYATALDAWVMLAPGVLLIVISSAIMILQTWKTARANPVEALRTE
jgi:putative ABC transport system permease protein